MGRVRFIDLSDIKKMLKSCAPGSTMEPTLHRFKVIYNGRTFLMNKGPHGKHDPPIEYLNVRAMVEHLQLAAACVNGHFQDMI